MDAFVMRCEHCNEPLSETTRGRPQKYCSDRCRQAHRKTALRTGNDLRYRTGRVKPKWLCKALIFWMNLNPYRGVRRVETAQSQSGGASHQCDTRRASGGANGSDLDPYEWDLPPKPKWMRWNTYNRFVERYDAYDAILDYGIAQLIAKFFSK